MIRTAPAVRTTGIRIAIVAGLAVLGWGVVRNGALAAFAETRPNVAMTFAPAGGAALANAAQARIVAAGGTADRVARTQTALALRRAPRDAAPLILAGLAASADGAADRAQALMEAARGRDPRSGIARYWLLDHYVRTAQSAKALAEVGPALRLRPGTRKAIYMLVSAMAAQPETRGAVRGALARDPDWRESFLTTQASANIDPHGLMRLFASLPPPADPAAAARERRAVLWSTVRAGAYGEAQALWRAGRPPVRGDAAPLRDPMFRDAPGDVPFVWNAPSVAGLQRQPGDGLRITYRGDAPATVAEQLVVGEGRFRLSLHGSGTNVVARLSCVRDEAPLAVAALEGDTVDAVIPARCGAAWLRIVATPDAGGTVAATVTNVRLTRA
ncbi:tetratricopeptide repeat protein [Sphingomonas sp. Leaf4]|uniref:tetratricopeptide repeat protein n=1 Tax=Sphingomonas sp. Leaf4 TaxID=2876553 RepID=UPI001E3DAB71|nr:hypothetical protein [Sphingomonas sp. Leaf4]